MTKPANVKNQEQQQENLLTVLLGVIISLRGISWFLIKVFHFDQKCCFDFSSMKHKT